MLSPFGSTKMMNDAAVRIESAEALDAADPLKEFRSRFHFPLGQVGDEAIYFTGNSLGLMPKRVREYVEEEFDDWAAARSRGPPPGKASLAAVSRISHRTNGDDNRGKTDRDRRDEFPDGESSPADGFVLSSDASERIRSLSKKERFPQINMRWSRKFGSTHMIRLIRCSELAPQDGEVDSANGRHNRCDRTRRRFACVDHARRR